ncbi:transcription factor HES-3-like [Dendropsophus ebraccatus]|uniref:transcription factor HES-3-like n=1 Tax=Dendropsophus ebraccatus TaxID=150705 RepID=UPI003831EEB8
MVTRAEPREPASFRKVSKPLMEKKRRARINVSLEQLKTLLENNYSQNIRKRKLEKADILELTVKYLKTLQNSVQGGAVFRSAEYQAGFRNCLSSVSQFLLKSEECGAPIGHLTFVQDQLLLLPPSSFSTKDSSLLPSATSADVAQPWCSQSGTVQSSDPAPSPCIPEHPALSAAPSPLTLPSRCPVQNVWRPW